MKTESTRQAIRETQLTVEEAYLQAIEHFNRGCYAEADKLCTAIIQVAPNHIDAINALGAIAQKVNCNDLAVEQFQKAINIDNSSATLYYNLGVALYSLGRVEEVATAQKKAISIKPDYAEAYSSLGNALKELGEFDEAVLCLQKALSIKPDYADAYYNLGNSLKEQGKLDKAIANLKKAITIQPDYIKAYNKIGNIKKKQGKLDEAVDSYQKAITINPNFADAYNNLSVVLIDQGKWDKAVANCRKVISLNPDIAITHFNLGNALKEQGKLDEAIASYNKAISIKPDFKKAYLNIGNTLKEQGKFDEAIARYKKIISITPDYAIAHSNIGIILQEQGKVDEAVARYKKAISIKPDYAEAHSNFGNTLQEQGKLDEAIARYKKAISIKPDLAEAHNNLGVSLLLSGDFENGWVEYEWWRKCKDNIPISLSKPLWDGTSLEGKTILLHCDQGLGDNLQFVRYTELIKKKGATVALLCPQPLQAIFKTVNSIDCLITNSSLIPPHDYQASLLSLPMIFRTTLESIPNKVPYLHTDQKLVDKYANLMANLEGFKVGIVWSGNPKFKNNKNRSIGADFMAKLLDVQGCIFISLQKEAKDDELKIFSKRSNFLDLSDHLEDFAETAAVMANLDLVISSDTSVIHLAGAIGKPAWALLMFNPDWRWLLKKDDSPWYPTLRLFRQPAPRKWKIVIEGVVNKLLKVVSGELPVIWPVKSI
ncbi:MAG: tetratricopeptide repeat protein [Magnetococcales bacterium]|nr:tetratricopeptide repeat protein [Magnetococcales bacterium]